MQTLLSAAFAVTKLRVNLAEYTAQCLLDLRTTGVG